MLTYGLRLMTPTDRLFSCDHAPAGLEEMVMRLTYGLRLTAPTDRLLSRDLLCRSC